MIKNLKKVLSLSLVFVVVVLSIGLIASSAFAVGESTEKACEGLTGIGVECDDSKTAGEVATGPLNSLVNILLIVVGVVSVVMIIFGGFKFVTSGGDTDKTKSARNTIIYAAIGLALVLLSSFIVSFVFNAADNIGGSPSDGGSTTDSSESTGDGGSSSGGESDE